MKNKFNHPTAREIDELQEKFFCQNLSKDGQQESAWILAKLMVLWKELIKMARRHKGEIHALAVAEGPMDGNFTHKVTVHAISVTMRKERCRSLNLRGIHDDYKWVFYRVWEYSKDDRELLLDLMLETMEIIHEGKNPYDYHIGVLEFLSPDETEDVTEEADAPEEETKTEEAPKVAETPKKEVKTDKAITPKKKEIKVVDAVTKQPIPAVKLDLPKGLWPV